MKKYQASFFTVDFLLLCASLMLFVVGLMFVFSTAVDNEGLITNHAYIRQLLFGLVGIVLMVSISLSDYRFWDNFIPFFYALTLFFLFLVPVLGREVSSTYRWFTIGGFGGQPSEFSKLSLILMLSRYFSHNSHNLKDFRHLVVAFLITLAPVSLIMLQPNLGTALIHLGIFFIMALIAGLDARYLFFGLLVGIFSVSLSLFPLWDKFLRPDDVSFFANIFLDKQYFLVYIIILTSVYVAALYGYFTTKLPFYGRLSYLMTVLLISSLFALVVVSLIMPYQVQRLLVFLDPSIDPRGAGWNVRQSVLAVGSGGFWGQGYLQGFHSHSRYVPEQVTDFIFSILAEEWGFVGVIFVFVLFLTIFFRIYVMIKKSETFFGSMACVGILAFLFIHFVINVGMAIGLFPIMGIPLPLMSYGGSAVLVMFMSLGVVLSVYRY
jgi:rod shape determining protein RodA